MHDIGLTSNPNDYHQAIANVPELQIEKLHLLISICRLKVFRMIR